MLYSLSVALKNFIVGGGGGGGSAFFHPLSSTLVCTHMHMLPLSPEGLFHDLVSGDCERWKVLDKEVSGLIVDSFASLLVSAQLCLRQWEWSRGGLGYQLPVRCYHYD